MTEGSGLGCPTKSVDKGIGVIETAGMTILMELQAVIDTITKSRRDIEETTERMGNVDMILKARMIFWI